MSEVRKLLHKIDNQFHQINVMAYCLKDDIKDFKAKDLPLKGKKMLKRMRDVLTDIEKAALQAPSLTNDLRQILKDWGKLE